MQSVYTIFYNDGDVSHIRYCNGYSHAEQLMSSVVEDFMKMHYTGLPRKICKYEGYDGEEFCAKLYKDSTFTNGLVFVQKKFEMTVYEKKILPGKVYNSYSVNYLGRFGVIAQQQEISEHTSMLIESLRTQITHKDQLLNQQEQLIRRQELEITRLEGQCCKLNEEIGQMQVSQWYSPSKEVSPLRAAPKTVLKIQNETIAPVLDELKNAFSNKSALLKTFKKKKLSKKSNDATLDKLIREIDDIKMF